MSTEGWILVEYRAGSAHPQLADRTVYDDVENAVANSRQKQRDAIADKQQKRIAVARIEVLQ